MLNKLGRLLKLGKEILSEGAYRKMLSIIEKDLGCVIDVDLKGEAGDKGASHS